MADINIIVAPESLSSSDNGPVWGAVYLQLDGHAFPDLRWDDLAVVFVAAWLRASLRLTRESRRERINFMDGPYYADLSKTSRGDNAELRIDLVCASKDVPGIRHTATVDVHWLFADAVRVARAVLAVCRQKGWDDADIRELAEAVDAASG